MQNIYKTSKQFLKISKQIHALWKNFHISSIKKFCIPENIIYWIYQNILHILTNEFSSLSQSFAENNGSVVFLQ